MSEGKIPCSCYIRTLNEAQRIERTISSVIDLVDEVIVADSGSKDDTIAIAEKLGAKVYRQEWLGNGSQKRFLESKCRNNWVLDLDADEVLTDEAREEIRSLFEGDGPPLRIYKLKTVFAFEFQEPWYNFARSYRAKLYDKSYIRMPDHFVWDQLQLDGTHKTKKLSAPVLHYSFPDLTHLMKKMNSVSTRNAKNKRLSYPVVLLRVFFGFPFYFFKNYIMRGMIRGGGYGFCVAFVIAMGRWLRDAKMLEGRS